jgi:hypothetical protein
VLTPSSFVLSQEQVDQINQHFASRAAAYRASAEDPPGSVKVVFEWEPIFGRSVTAYFDGAVKGLEIEGEDHF